MLIKQVIFNTSTQSWNTICFRIGASFLLTMVRQKKKCFICHFSHSHHYMPYSLILWSCSHPSSRLCQPNIQRWQRRRHQKHEKDSTQGASFQPTCCQGSSSRVGHVTCVWWLDHHQKESINIAIHCIFIYNKMSKQFKIHPFFSLSILHYVHSFCFILICSLSAAAVFANADFSILGRMPTTLLY